MRNTVLTGEHLQKFKVHLFCEEKSTATIDKYCRDVRAFLCFAAARELTKAEYLRLLEAAKGQAQLKWILQTIWAQMKKLCAAAGVEHRRKIEQLGLVI